MFLKPLAPEIVGQELDSGAPPLGRRQADRRRAGRSPRAPRKTPADFVQHILRLKQTLPEDGRFTIVVQPPFVVIGDESPEDGEIAIRADRQMGRRSYQAIVFRHAIPTASSTSGCSRTKPATTKHVKAIFDDTPTTPYGYFSAVHGALIMNIATGGGTLVHEIVHPFMAANFPKCPSWFNEGLASLYEQAGEEKGRIHGYPNWRLPGLQQAIKAKAVSTVREALRHDDRAVLQRRPRHQLQPGPVSLLLSSREGPARKILPRFPRPRRRRPERL